MDVSSESFRSCLDDTIELPMTYQIIKSPVTARSPANRKSNLFFGESSGTDETLGQLRSDSSNDNIYEADIQSEYEVQLPYQH